MMNDASSFIDFQQIMGELKHLKRTGWVMRNVPEAETVAAHSWRMAVMAMQKEKELCRLGADVNHIIKMCILHDVSEAVVGDIVPEHHQISEKKISKLEKHQLEIAAVKDMANQYGFENVRTFFTEYEEQNTLEAVVVKNLDKLDMILQAYEYLKMYPELTRLNEFIEHNEQDVSLPVFQDELQEIKLRQFDKKL